MTREALPLVHAGSAQAAKMTSTANKTRARCRAAIRQNRAPATGSSRFCRVMGSTSDPPWDLPVTYRRVITAPIRLVTKLKLTTRIMRAGIVDATIPSAEEVKSIAGIVKADAVITGALKEYGDVRSSAAISTVISLSVQLVETQTGKVVWAASTTKGGITFTDRLFGGGGEPMNVVTEKAVDDIIDKLFK